MANVKYAGWPAHPVQSLPVHQHEPWILILYTYGRGAAHFDGELIPFQPGTVLCVPPRTPYAETSQNGFTSLFAASNDVPFSPSRVRRCEDRDRAMRRLGEVMVDEWNRGTAPSRRIAGQLFDVLLLYLSKEDRSTANPAVVQLRDSIQRNWADPDFSVGDAMNALPVSPSHLRREFVREYGAAPAQFLLQHRITQARRLLGLGGFSVKETSRLCGFADPYYFSRAFRKIAGCAPSSELRG